MATTSLLEIDAGVIAIGGRTDFAGDPVTDLTAEEARFHAIAFSEGALQPYDAFVPVPGAALTMNVVIGSGSAKTDYYVVEGSGSGQGNYIVRLASATKTVTLSPASFLPRFDEIWLVVLDDAYDGEGVGVPVLALRTGTPDADPEWPGADPDWEACTLIAGIEVPSSATDIEDCLFIDARSHSTVSTAWASPVPVGSVTLFAGSSTPSGWRYCDGSAVSRTQYAALFSVIGTDFGAGNGTTTFNLPTIASVGSCEYVIRT